MYKPGDTVKVKDSAFTLHKSIRGQTGTIEKVHATSGVYTVRINNRDVILSGELIEVSPLNSGYDRPNRTG